MDNQNVDQGNDTQTAVPYTPPPPPGESSENAPHQTQTTTGRSPLVNTLIISAVVMTAGFMMFNFIGHGLTQTAGQSVGPADTMNNLSPTPSVSPSPTY